MVNAQAAPKESTKLNIVSWYPPFQSRFIWFSEYSFEHNSNYHLIGVLCGLAIYNSTIGNNSINLSVTDIEMQSYIKVFTLIYVEFTIFVSFQLTSTFHLPCIKSSSKSP